jgi:hypothetical protein
VPQELLTRIDGLLYVISSQQDKLQKMSKAMRLKGMWKKTIIPHASEDNESKALHVANIFLANLILLSVKV